jgi:hypothetical protein
MKFMYDFYDACLTRDKDCCVFCKSKKELDVHQITNGFNLPNGGYAPSNGITLCKTCALLVETRAETSEWVLSDYSTKNLYEKIGSSYEKAYADSENLTQDEYQTGP